MSSPAAVERRRRIGVRALLFLVLSLSAALPVALFGVHQARRWSKQQIAVTDQQLAAAARASADQLALSLIDSVHAAQAFSDQVGARGSLTADSMLPALTAHTANHPELLGAYIADARGISLVHRSLDGETAKGGIDYSDRDYFKQVASTQRAAVSRAQVGRFTRVLSVNVAAPIRDATGGFLGITCSSLDLRDVSERGQRAVGGVSEGRLVVVDAEGRRLADSRDNGHVELVDVSRLPLFASVRERTAETRVGSDERGRRVRSVAVGLGAPIAGWRVIAMSPHAVIDAHARAVQLQALFVSLALVLVTLGLSAWLADWLARPLRSIANAAAAVQEGDLRSIPPQRDSAPREIAQLGIAISAMLARLRAYTQELESQVAERTRELVHANAELSSALATIQKTDELIRADIEQARLFQEKMLPALRERTDLSIATRYLPLEQVSGDIFDVCELAPNHIRLFLADATGHGVQAAMRTIFVKSSYDRLKTTCASPSDVLRELNEKLVGEFPERDLVCSACCVDLRISSQGVQIEYANAAAEPLLLFSDHGGPTEVYCAGPPLGAMSCEWPSPLRRQLAPEELLLIASDGLLEQMNSRQQRFEAELPSLRLPALPESALDYVLSRFDSFRGTRAVADDVTLIAIAVHAS